MICLDTNYLILGLICGTQESEEMVRWYRAGEALLTPMPAWYEFICGPVTEKQILTIRAFLAEVIPFGEIQATRAAALFNHVGRVRSLRVDAMIAGTAVAAGAPLATNNQKDFARFQGAGLRLVGSDL